MLFTLQEEAKTNFLIRAGSAKRAAFDALSQLTAILKSEKSTSIGSFETRAK